MGLETATYISGLNASNPVNATDVVGEGDDHLRLIKSTLLNSFPGITGAMSLTHTQLNNAAIQDEANTFTSAQTISMAGAAALRLIQTDATADEGTFEITSGGDQFLLRTRTDALAFGNNFLIAKRSGTDIESLQFNVAAGETAILATQNAGVGLYYNGTLRASSASNGLQLDWTGIASTPPIASDAPNTRIQFYDLGGSNLLSQIGHAGGSTLQFSCFIHGATLQLRGEDTSGTSQDILLGDPDGATQIFYAGTKRLVTASDGNVDVFSDASPGIGASQTARVYFKEAGGTELGICGFRNNDALSLHSFNHGGGINLTAEDGAGAGQTLATFDPDGAVTLYYDGTVAMLTSVAGIRVRDTSGDDPLLEFADDANGRKGYITASNGANGFEIRSEHHGANMNLIGEDAGGTARTFLNGDPDGVTILRGDTNVTIQVAAGETAISALANAGISLYYDNQLQFRTSSEASADIGMGAEVRHNDDSFYPVGMNVLPEDSAIDSGNETLALDNVGKVIHYNSGTARSLFVNNDANIKVGSMWTVIVGPSAGTLTVDGGTGVVMRYWNGSSWTATGSGGNITAGEGQYTIWKETDTVFYVSGPNLS